MPQHKLTLRQRKFFELYHQNGGNSMRAAIEAGYSPKTAKQASVIILRNPRLQEQWKQEIEKDVDFFRVTPGIREKITIDFILDNIVKVYNEAKKDSTRLQALEMLGKWKAMFTDKQEVVSRIAQITKEITADFKEKPVEALPEGEPRSTLEDVLPVTTTQAQEAVKENS